MSFFAAFIRRQFISWPPLPAADVSFKGKTAIITGSSGGLGAEAARWLVKLGAAKVIIAVRNTNKAGAIIKDIIATTSCPPSTLEAWALDMSSYESVQAFAERAKKLPRLDALLSNAGVAIRFNFNKTELDEETITTNVVSMALLSFLLHPKLKETAVRFNTQTHLTITGSELYEVAEFKERNVPTGQIFTTLATKEKSKLTDRYNVSKLLDLFVLRDMAAISPASSSGVIINVVAPGFCHSGLGCEMDNVVLRLVKKLLCRPTEVGSRTLVYGATAGPETHGQYLPDCKITALKGLAKGTAGEELQNRVCVELKQKLENIQAGVTALS